MPLYEVALRCYLPLAPGSAHSRFFEIGETVEFAGVPGRSLTPLDAAAIAATAARNSSVPYEFLSNGVQVRHRGTGALLNATIGPRIRLP